MSRHYIGIDLGTSSIKMGLFDEKLKALSKFQKKYHYDSLPNGGKEIDPATWFDIVQNGLKRLLEDIDETNHLVSIVITGQMHTTVFLDGAGQSIRPAIIWNDTRTKNMIDNLKLKLGAIGQTENEKIISTGSPLANLVWLQANEPENFKQLRHFLMPVDYVAYRLTGEFSTDYCDASTSSLYDFQNNTWSNDICKTFNLDYHILPPIKSSSEISGKIQKSIKDGLGLDYDVNVLVGTGDNAATALANRTEDSQQPLISLGTSGVVVIPNRKNQLKKVGKNIIFSLVPNEKMILTQGTVQTGAILNEWWLQSIIKTDNVSGEQSAIPKKLLGKNNVLFLPHLNGEKTLYANPDLRGAFLGLNLETNRQNMYLAVLEGLAFACRRLYDKMRNTDDIKYLQLVGGGAKSNLWLSIFANVFNKPVHTSIDPKEAMEGAVLLAFKQDGVSVPLKSNAENIILPDAEIVQNYQKQYERYLQATSQLLELEA